MKKDEKFMGYTQDELSKMLNVSTRTIENKVKGYTDFTIIEMLTICNNDMDKVLDFIQENYFKKI